MPSLTCPSCRSSHTTRLKLEPVHICAACGHRFVDPADSEACASVVCPHCRSKGAVRVSTLIMSRERHLHYHCSCCRHAWVERERRGKERALEYQPPMAK